MNYIAIPGLIVKIDKPIKFFSANRILSVVADYFSLTREQLLEHTNRREIVYPRQIAMHVLRNYSRLSLREIKEQVTLQNHTSPVYATRRLKDLMDVDERVTNDVKEITENL